MRARQTAVATLFPATLSVDPDLCDLIRRNIWGKMNGGAPRAGPGGVAGYTQAMLEATAETMVTLGLRDAGYGAEPPQPSWDGPLGLPLLALLQRPRSVPIQCRCRQGDTAAFGASYCSPPRTASHCLALPRPASHCLSRRLSRPLAAFLSPQRRYVYMNLDCGWTSGHRDATGLLVNTSAFPNMTGLIDKVHSLGMKFGMYAGGLHVRTRIAPSTPHHHWPLFFWSLFSLSHPPLRLIKHVDRREPPHRPE